MPDQSVTAIYGEMSKAEEAVYSLHRSGFPVQQISIVSQNLESQRDIHGYITTGDVAKSSAGIGAWFGGLFGLLVGAAFVWVPGFGPLVVAGPFAAHVLAAIEGAVAVGAGSGLLGALMNAGISQKHIPKYEDKLKAGKFLVIAHGTGEELEKARAVLQGTGADEVTIHADDEQPAV